MLRRLAQPMQLRRFMRTTPAGRAAMSSRYQDIHGLRATLPRYWWAEVSRVRALIEADAVSGLFETQCIAYAAEALKADDDPLSRQHAVALWAASRQLRAIAQRAEA